MIKSKRVKISKNENFNKHQEDKENCNLANNSNISSNQTNNSLTKTKEETSRRKILAEIKDKTETKNKIGKTPFLGLRKNYQEETEKNEKVVKRPSKTSKSIKEESTNKKRSASYQLVPVSEILLEDLFFKKPKLKPCLSDYYKVDHDNLSEEGRPTFIRGNPLIPLHYLY